MRVFITKALLAQSDMSNNFAPGCQDAS